MPQDVELFTLKEVAAYMKVGYQTARSLFIDEPGVVKLGERNKRKKREYYTIRVPRTVLERKLQTLTTI